MLRLNTLRPTSTLAPSSFIFDNKGARLIATYDGRQIIGKVSPQAMALASPVWKKFFYPPWHAESGQSNLSEGASAAAKLHHFAPAVAEVDFSEDDGPALLILLQITHLQLAKVKTKIAFDVLFDIAVLCDKYDCVQLVKPWLSDWYLNLRNSEPDLISQAHITRLLKCLFVHWVFGKEDEFHVVSRNILLDLELHMIPQDMTTRHDQLLLDAIWPSGIKATILPARSKVIEQILGRVRTRLIRYSKKRGVLCRFGKHECDASIYGSIIQGFEACKVYSVIDAQPPADSVTKSISQLSTELTSIRVYALNEKNNKHMSCEREIDLKGSFQINDLVIPCLVEDSHVRHMEIQRKKLSGEL